MRHDSSTDAPAEKELTSVANAVTKPAKAKAVSAGGKAPTVTARRPVPVQEQRMPKRPVAKPGSTLTGFEYSAHAPHPYDEFGQMELDTRNNNPEKFCPSLNQAISLSQFFLWLKSEGHAVLAVDTFVRSPRLNELVSRFGRSDAFRRKHLAEIGIFVSGEPRLKEDFVCRFNEEAQRLSYIKWAITFRQHFRRTASANLSLLVKPNEPK